LGGDRMAFKLIFEKYAAKMVAICTRYMKSKAAAEDVVQEGFIKVYRKLNTYQNKGSFEAWVRVIMINTALKELSKKHNKQEIISLESHWGPSFEPEVISYLGEEELLNLIMNLPTGYRTVFNMYVIEGYSHKEIGEKLSIGESTSRSQLVKARNMLKNMVISLQKLAV
jgi:RNA polymerase sigma-70 factor (ECF subfamily)